MVGMGGAFSTGGTSQGPFVHPKVTYQLWHVETALKQPSTGSAHGKRPFVDFALA